MIFPNFYQLGLLIWCALSIVIHAYNLDERLEPQGPLGVRLDYNLATSWPEPLTKKGRQIRRTFLWTSHLKFMEPVSKISDGQLWQMAHDAYDEMTTEMERYGVKANKDVSTGFTVLAFGNEIILSSSVKGPGYFAYDYPPSTVSKSLQLCQITWEAGGGEQGKIHKNQGSCGEVMAAQLYYTIYDAPLAEQNARVGAVLLSRDDQKLVKTPPCGTERSDVWGCNLFVSREGLIVLDENIESESYDLKDLAGGLDTVGQIQICGSPTTG